MHDPLDIGNFSAFSLKWLVYLCHSTLPLVLIWKTCISRPQILDSNAIAA